MPKRYLDTGGKYDKITLNKKKPFVYNDIDLQYEVDTDKLRVNPETGEVYQQRMPKGAVILPEVEVKGSQLKAVENANEQLEKTPKEKGLENPMIDPLLLPLSGGRYTGDIVGDVLGEFIGSKISKYTLARANKALFKKFNIEQSLNDALRYKESIGYKELVKNAIQESNDLGIGDFSEDLFLNSGHKYKPTITFSKRRRGSLASYRYGINTVDIDPSQIISKYQIEGVPYHEFLHWKRIGSPEINTPEYKAWNDNLEASKEEQNRLWNIFYKANGKKLINEERNANKYLKKKISDALYDDAEDYLRKPGELQINGLEAGRVLNIEPFSPYPGIEEVSKVAKAARVYNSYLRDIKLLSKTDYENFWKILTGNYIPAVLPTTIGSTIYNFNNNKSKQKSIKRNGGSIHIAPSKRGTFTAAATKHGMGVQEFAARVLRNKDNYSPSLVKKANFARNASKWNH